MPKAAALEVPTTRGTRETKRFRIALAGNPNAGKTSIFNNLTGARQHVGNYPGVTVERREGVYKHGDCEVATVDLPGTYSLTAYSIDEVIARDFIIKDKPQVVVDIVDATNLERHLYLTLELLELGAPLVLALNMSDEAEAAGVRIDTGRLSHRLGAPVVTTVGNRNRGMEDLRNAVVKAASLEDPREPLRIDYGEDIEGAIAQLQALAEPLEAVRHGYQTRWLAIKRLEDDDAVIAWFSDAQLADAADAIIVDLEARLGDAPPARIAEKRYHHITHICNQVLEGATGRELTLSDRIDNVVSHRILGLPIFLGLMYGVFYLVFSLGAVPMGWIEAGTGGLASAITGLWPAGAESPLKSLVVDGIIGGVGGVVVFLPNIVLLFLAISVLENSGYMARAAFIMDGFMHRLGLHGKSFIPLLVGFGCTVPAIMATRTLGNTRDRLITMLVAPLMSCGARLPIYALIIPAFFPHVWHGPVLWIVYMMGILFAMLCAKLLGVTLFKGASAPFIMELPPYRIPTLKSVMVCMWERSWLYLKKAGTVILGVSIVMWAFSSYPKPPEGAASADAEGGSAAVANAELSYSVSGRLGQVFEPILRPIGFDWKIGTALVGAFAAKEVFVAQMGIVYSLGDGDGESDALREKLKAAYSPLQGLCIMVFCLIGMPCMATLAVTKRESNSWKWPLFQTTALTALAYLVTLVVYQLGTALGLGTL